MPASEKDKARVRRIVSTVYVEGYAQGIDMAAGEYGLDEFRPQAVAHMPEPLTLRLDFVDKAVDRYVDLIERKAQALAAEGKTGDELRAAVLDYAAKLAENRGEIIAQTEFAQARLDGASRILDASGRPYLWHFPHLGMGRAGHEECPICIGIREGGPYTSNEAKEQGFPTFPHPPT